MSPILSRELHSYHRLCSHSNNHHSNIWMPQRRTLLFTLLAWFGENLSNFSHTNFFPNAAYDESFSWFFVWRVCADNECGCCLMMLALSNNNVQEAFVSWLIKTAHMLTAEWDDPMTTRGAKKKKIGRKRKMKICLPANMKKWSALNDTAHHHSPAIINAAQNATWQQKNAGQNELENQFRLFVYNNYVSGVFDDEKIKQK